MASPTRQKKTYKHKTSVFCLFFTSFRLLQASSGFVMKARRHERDVTELRNVHTATLSFDVKVKPTTWHHLPVKKRPINIKLLHIVHQIKKISITKKQINTITDISIQQLWKIKVYIQPCSQHTSQPPNQSLIL